MDFPDRVRMIAEGEIEAAKANTERLATLFNSLREDGSAHALSTLDDLMEQFSLAMDQVARH